jgi:hypothetical protein
VRGSRPSGDLKLTVALAGRAGPGLGTETPAGRGGARRGAVRPGRRAFPRLAAAESGARRRISGQPAAAAPFPHKHAAWARGAARRRTAELRALAPQGRVGRVAEAARGSRVAGNAESESRVAAPRLGATRPTVKALVAAPRAAARLGRAQPRRRAGHQCCCMWPFAIFICLLSLGRKLS